MTHFIATLIAGKESSISIITLEKIEEFVQQSSIGLAGKPAWITPHKSARLPIQNMPLMEQVFEIRKLLTEDRVDVLFTPAYAAPIRLFLADMDSTIVTSETLDELAEKAGIKDKIAAITARAMNGELDFHDALKERVGLLKGLPVSALQETLDETFLCSGAKELLQGLVARDIQTVLVSGGFTVFTDAIARQCGFHHNHGNTLNHDGKTLNGTVGEPILDKDAKLAYLIAYAQELGLEMKQTMAIGDGANDLPMLCAAGLGIGYRPKPIVAQTIPNVLLYADLDDLLCLTMAVH